MIKPFQTVTTAPDYMLVILSWVVVVEYSSGCALIYFQLGTLFPHERKNCLFFGR